MKDSEWKVVWLSIGEIAEKYPKSRKPRTLDEYNSIYNSMKDARFGRGLLHCQGSGCEGCSVCENWNWEKGEYNEMP